MRRRVELTALLALGTGELREEIFVDPPQDVFGSRLRVTEADVTDQVDELAEALLVEARASEVLRQHPLQGRVVALDRCHRVIDKTADGRLWCLGLEITPARFGRYPEDVDRTVLVRIL